MFLRKAALRPVPNFAAINTQSMMGLEQALDNSGENLQGLLDDGYQDMDHQQPVLAGYLANEVAERRDEMVQSVGYFLTVAVYLAFRDTFTKDLVAVDENELSVALDELRIDEEIRANDPTEVLDSDDVIALGQPVLIEFIQHHIRNAVDQSQGDVDMDELERVYRALLVEIIALSHAVSPPSAAGPASTPMLA